MAVRSTAADVQVVILAGGRGTRLGEHARTVPKPMVTIGGRPNLEHQLLLARRYGFKNVLFLVSHLADRIEAHFGDGRSLGAEISYCIEDPPLGTAGALCHADALLQDRFLVLYGDVFVECDLARLWTDHANHRPLPPLSFTPMTTPMTATSSRPTQRDAFRRSIQSRDRSIITCPTWSTPAWR
jgi:mannose-1-phosphate guanylyltransferase / phosphomannomutase